MRGAIASLVTAAVVSAAAPAAAQDRAIWGFVLNEEAKGDIAVVLLDDGPWVDPRALVAAGIRRLPAGVRRIIPPDGTPHVSLRSLAPALTFTLDENDIRLIVVADPSILAEETIAISNPRPPGWKVDSSAAVFLNYSADWSTTSGSTGYGEFGLHLFGTLFETAAIVDDEGVVTPGLTSLTVDQVGSRRRWVFGDTIGRTTSLGSTAVVGGISIGTQADLDPYYAAYPAPQIRGAVRAPATADVYVDGRLVSSVRLPPGRFTLNDLPIEAGLGNARVVIRDSLGRQQSIELGFYLSTQLLKRGEHDYSYVAGAERSSTGNTVSYGRLVGTGYHAYGLTDWLTIGAQAEGAEDLMVAGAGFGLRLWRLGLLGGNVLVSQAAPKEQGAAATAAYTFLSRVFSTDLRATWIGPHYRNLYLEPANLAQFTGDASMTVTLGSLGSLTLGGSIGTAAAALRLAQYRPDFVGRLPLPPRDALKTALEQAEDRALRVAYTVNVTSRAQLSATATRTERPGQPKTWTGFGSLTFALGWRTVASAVTTVDDEGTALTTVNAQRSLPMGEGFGFRLDADTQKPYATTGVFEVQHRRGVIGVRAEGAQDRTTNTIVNIAGSLVGIGGEVLFSRPVDDGFALVKVPQSRRVRVLANNQPAGRTGRRGSLFVPDLRSYLSSPIAIVQDDLPVDVRLGAVRQDIAVPYRGGTVVTFEAEVIRALVGRIDTGGVPPSYGTLIVTAGPRTFSSPLNAQGEFYFEELPPGDHPGQATWQGNACRVTVRMPAGTASMNDVGIVRCAGAPQ